MTTKQSKKSSAKSEEFQCKWCKKSFKRETTLVRHMCVKKRRWADRDATHIRLAYNVFLMFYKNAGVSTKPKTREDFIQSPYYEGFVKFGRACLVNEYLYPEKFAEWLIQNAKKLEDWPKDKTYDEYLLQFVKREPGLRALERNIIYLSDWSAETGHPWNEYFLHATTPRAVYDIRSAKISPWLLYLSETGDQLLTRFSDEQVKMINHLIDAGFWMQVFKKNPEEVDEVQAMTQAAGI